MEPDKLYTVKTLAEVLELSERTIRDKASMGIIPNRKLFGKFYFYGADIIAHIGKEGKPKGEPSNFRGEI